MAEAIVTSQLSKSYGKTLALDSLDMEVRTGEIFGFLGPNGAGKTTTIRLLLDVLRPSSGSSTVLGVDPRSGGIELRKRVGYLPGDFVVDGRQSPRQFLTYMGNLRGGVSPSAISDISERLDLDLGLHALTPRTTPISREARRAVTSTDSMPPAGFASPGPSRANAVSPRRARARRTH